MKAKINLNLNEFEDPGELETNCTIWNPFIYSQTHM